MSSQFNAIGPGTSVSPEPTPQPAPASGPVQTTVVYTEPINVQGYAWLDIAALLTVDGVAPAITNLYYYPEWSLSPTLPISDEEWVPLYREEFEMNATPTGNGEALESVYFTNKPIAPGSLPKSVGVTFRTRGIWMRVGIVGDGAVSDINAAVRTLRRSP